MSRYFITVLALGLFAVSGQTYACTDYSGDYIHVNFSMTLKQSGCESLDITYHTSGTPSTTDHYDIGKLSRRNFIADPRFAIVEYGLVFENDKLVDSTKYLSAAGDVTKTVIYTFALDSNRNLVEDFSFSFPPKASETFSDTLFKRVGN